MQIKGKSICFQCLSLSEDENVCRYCGSKIQEISKLKQKDENALRQGNLLESCFVVGNLSETNGLFNRYEGLDLSTETRKTIIELYPWDLVKRGADNITVMIERPDAYERVQERFQKRCTDMLRNQFPGMEKIDTCFEENGTTYIITQSISEQVVTLRHIMDTEKTETVLSVIKELAKSINILHQNGYVYGLINPETILISADKSVTLPLTFPEFSRYTTKNMFQSPYIPPEIFEGVGIGSQSDVYGICAMIYEAFRGTELPPCDTRQNQEQVLKHLKRTKCSKDFAAALNSGLILSEDNRTDNLDTILQHLESYNEAITPASMTKTQTAKPKKKAKEDNGKANFFMYFILLFAAVVIVMVIFLSVMAGSNKNRTKEKMQTTTESTEEVEEETPTVTEEVTEPPQTPEPTEEATPTMEPTPSPTEVPTPSPTPSAEPTPTESPTEEPTASPTMKPTKKPKKTKKPKATKKPKRTKKPKVTKIPSTPAPVRTKKPASPKKTKKPTVQVVPGDGTDIEWIN